MADLSDTQPDEGQEPLAKPEPLVIITGDEDQNRGYQIGKWHRFKNYKCIYCQFATIFLAKMEKHQAVGKHPWAFPGQNPVEPGQVLDDDPEY